MPDGRRRAGTASTRVLAWVRRAPRERSWHASEARLARAAPTPLSAVWQPQVIPMRCWPLRWRACRLRVPMSISGAFAGRRTPALAATVFQGWLNIGKVGKLVAPPSRHIILFTLLLAVGLLALVAVPSAAHCRLNKRLRSRLKKGELGGLRPPSSRVFRRAVGAAPTTQRGTGCRLGCLQPPTPRLGALQTASKRQASMRKWPDIDGGTLKWSGVPGLMPIGLGTVGAMECLAVTRSRTSGSAPR